MWEGQLTIPDFTTSSVSSILMPHSQSDSLRELKEGTPASSSDLGVQPLF